MSQLLKPRGQKLSQSFMPPIQDAGNIARALLAIDRVHGVNFVADEKINIVFATGMEERGRFTAQPDTGILVKISAKTVPLERAAVTVHEIGHFLDLAISSMNGYSSETLALWKPWRDVMEQTDAATSLRALERSLESSATQKRFASYFLMGRELFARAYFQYVTERSGDEELTQYLLAEQKIADKTGYNTRWSEDDFAPIAEEIDTVFESLRWLKK